MSNFIGVQGCSSVSGPAVVIDVMRAFTVAPWAIQKGAEKIVLVEAPEDALRLKAETPESLAFTDWPM
ncbi:MAG: 2-phosphosulfolactate phosphatase, partial [Gammaproteobacteria bacterium]